MKYLKTGDRNSAWMDTQRILLSKKQEENTLCLECGNPVLVFIMHLFHCRNMEKCYNDMKQMGGRKERL